MLRVATATALGGLAFTANAVPVTTLGFAGLNYNESITKQVACVTISATGGINEAWVYDTSTHGRVPDLSGPFTEIHSGGLTTINPGNVLIVQENHNTAPDDNAGGGTVRLEFEAAIKLLSIDVFDINTRSSIQLFGETGAIIGSVYDLGDSETNASPNEFEHILFGENGVAGVKSMEVYLSQPGAIDNVSYVPLPAAAWLFGSVPPDLSGIVRRRKAS
jgi:hypothetical protein